MMYRLLVSSFFLFAMIAFAGCGDDGDGDVEADRLGVGAQCDEDADCVEEASCLDAFKGGYCGLLDCEANEDCPQGSACVAFEDNTNYCFRICANKSECNRHRSVDFEANCSSSVDFVDPDFDAKACVPPSN